MIDFQNPGTQAIIQSIVAVVTAIATVALTWLTSRYVRLTGSMLEEARRSKEPNIYIDLEFREYRTFTLIVGNSGSTPAHNIKIKVTESAPWETDGFQGLDVITNGISYIAPGRELKYEVGDFDYRNFGKADTSIIFCVSFCNQSGRTCEATFKVDLSQYRSVLPESFTKPEFEIARAIKEVEHSRITEQTVNNWLMRKNTTNP